MSEAQAYRDTIATRIARLEREILTLKSQHNSVSSICRLPTEILSNIFTYLAWRDRFQGQGRIRLTHVCRHWRAVAIECPALWSDLPLVNSEFTASIIHRSKNAPISLRIAGGDYGKRHGESLRAILPEFHRLKRIDVHISENFRKILEEFPSSAPMLETLRLNCTGRSPTGGLPPGFLVGNVPRLTTLYLSMKGMLWATIPLRSTLTTLYLYQRGFPFETSAGRPSVMVFREALRELSRLRSLFLWGFLPANQSVNTSQLHPRIVLPELRSLDLVDYHNPIRQFLHLTQLPAVTLVDLDFMDFIREAPVLGHIFTEIQSAWNKGEPATSPMRRPVERMDVWEFDETHNSAPTIALYFREPTSPLGPNSEAQLRFSLCRDNLQVEDIIAEVKGYTNFSSSLTALEVYNFTAFPKESWRSSFGDCSALRKIGFIRSNGIRHFITALNNDLAWADSYPDAHADDSKPSPPMLMLPSLNVIELVWITNFNLDLDGPADVLIGLGGMLKNRLNSPHPILELHFDECNAVEQKHLLRLRDQVGPDLRVFRDGNVI